MQAYGRRRGDELEDRYLGATSKHRRMRHRKACRRVLYRQARNDVKVEIRCEIDSTTIQVHQ